MNFTQIKLNNFGLYNGEHQLNLRPLTGGVTSQPIILIGGKNGAGKTTLLEAVKLCLYGAASLGFGTKPKDYREYLLSRIHRPPIKATQNTLASVAVSFEHSVTGVLHTFDVERLWKRKGQSRISETLTVSRDGEPLNEQQYTWWEQFLHELLPPGLADLFFFDGEKIQALADDPDYNELAGAIRALLGLDLIDRLRADISIYVSRQKRKGGKGLEEELSALTQERAASIEAFVFAQRKLNEINQQIEHKKGEVEEAERLLASEGGDIATQRDALKARAKEIENEIERYERIIAEQASGLLPFAVIPELCESLWVKLVHEEQLAQQIATRHAADSLMQQFLSQLQQNDQWLNGTEVEHKSHLVTGLRGVFDEMTASLLDIGSTPPPLLHDTSNRERSEMLEWLSQAVESTPQPIEEAAIGLEEAHNALAVVQALLLKEPEEEILRPIFAKLATLHQEITILKLAQEAQEAEVNELHNKRAALDRKEEELYKRVMRGNDPAKRVEVAKNAQHALLKYEERLRAAKITQFEKQIVSCFSELSNKGGYIRQVKIDPKTFKTTLYNHQGNPIEKKQLSAGEKQIYAVALLWALRLVSGRRVPIIIDTPLGRLDATHRHHLVQHYFPRASHQVILLSTDTEIDQELYSELHPTIARTYHLTYIPHKACSKIIKGYFW